MPTPKQQAKTALPESLRSLVGVPVTSAARATRATDGRRVPLVFATVTGPSDTPRGGVLVELLDADGEPVDATRTSATGLAVLRFPPRQQDDDHKHDHHGTSAAGAVRGRLRIHDGSADGVVEDVEVAAARTQTLRTFVLDGPEEAGRVLPGDDQLARLPVDFSPETCHELTGGRIGGLLGASGLPTRPDPLLPATPGQLSLAGRRTPIVRRLDVIRRVPSGRRWLVQLRQEWVLLGYTLGELSGVTPLDPGAVLQRADHLLDTVTGTVRDATDTVRSTLDQTLGSLVSEIGTLDTVVGTVGRVSGNVSGGAIGIPGLAVAGNATATVDVDATVTTDVDTSLLVNRSLHQVATLVNQAVARAEALTQGAQRSATSVVNHLAPLVSRVTNALHWRVYENYAVCTHVDGVLALEEHTFGEESTDDFGFGFLFSDHWARVLRAFLEPALLDPALLPYFDALNEAAEAPAITHATVELRYSATQPFRATIRLGAATATIELPSGTDRVAVGTVTFDRALPPGSRTYGIVRFAPVSGREPTGLTVERMQVWADNPLDGPGDFVKDRPPMELGFDLHVEGTRAHAGAATLVNHLNANRAYYLGVLAAAALRLPALRVDAGRPGGPLAGLPAEVWDLPVVGFEGNKIVVARPPAAGDEVPELAALARPRPWLGDARAAARAGGVRRGAPGRLGAGRRDGHAAPGADRRGADAVRGLPGAAGPVARRRGGGAGPLDP